MQLERESSINTMKAIYELHEQFLAFDEKILQNELKYQSPVFKIFRHIVNKLKTWALNTIIYLPVYMFIAFGLIIFFYPFLLLFYNFEEFNSLIDSFFNNITYVSIPVGYILSIAGIITLTSQFILDVLEQIPPNKKIKRGFFYKIKHKIRNKFFNVVISKNEILKNNQNQLHKQINNALKQDFIKEIYAFYENHPYKCGTEENLHFALKIKEIKNLYAIEEYTKILTLYKADVEKFNYYSLINKI